MSAPAARAATLAPCPFCGGAALVGESHPLLPGGKRDTLFCVRCTRRECQIETMDWYPREAAITAWNRRQPALPDRETLVAVLSGHWLQRSCLGCSCGEVYWGKYDDDALGDWHLGHVADALRAALAERA